jgi:hypothetical protein
MLQPNKDRLDYGDLLMPPEGFQLENAIATSYSLDLDALISIPVALYLAHSLEVNIKQDIVPVLDSIRRASTTVKVFCQKGQIKVPDKQHRLYSFVEPCIVQIPPTQYHSFHPKVWVLRYKDSFQEVRYRVIVLSRNLTFDRSWDVAFALDGTVPRKKRSPKKRINKPLIDFIKYLTKHDTSPWYDQFIQDLWKTDFDLGLSPFEAFEFVPLGIHNGQVEPLLDKGKHDDLLVISPFVTKGGLEAIRRYSSVKPTLLSREEELRKIDSATLQKYDIWHLDPNFVQGEEKTEIEYKEDNKIQFQDLHAKVYCYKMGWNACLLLGSANCSERAMHRNVEFMIKLYGKNSKMGPGVLRKELIENEMRLFQEFDLSSTEVVEEDDLLHDHEKELQFVRIELANAALTANAVIQEDSNYQIDFIYTLSELKTEVEMRCHLINNEDQSAGLRPREINSWSVKNIKELDISSFLVIELSIPNSPVHCRFALKVNIEDLPESRNARIFRDIISNTATFFKYIRFLLAENAWESMHGLDEAADGLDDESKSKWQYSFALDEAIYENMLKAASREPHKLSEIKEIMERLSQEDDHTTPVIPDDFKALWQVFESAQRN